MTEDGKFLPYVLKKYDLAMFRALCLNEDQITVIRRHCRSLYKQENNDKQVDTEFKGTRVIDINQINNEIKEKQEKLRYLQCFLSLKDNKVIINRKITMQEENHIIFLLNELEFSKERIELLKKRIHKFNNQVEQNILSEKLDSLKKELFTNKMFNQYSMALQVICDESIVFKSVKEKLASQLAYIDDILINYINGLENKDDTYAYLVMAFEDLAVSLKLVGPRLTRKL